MIRSLTPRNLGRFVVRDDVLIDMKSHEDAVRIFDGMVIYETRHRYDVGGTEYLAAAPQFEEVAEGLEAPWYEFKVDRIDGSIEWWKREVVA